MTDINDIKRELEALTAKVAAYEAEKATKRNWPERIEAGDCFEVTSGARWMKTDTDGILVCIRDEHGKMDAAGVTIKVTHYDDMTYLGHARDILTIRTDAHEPTGVELVGRVCEFADLMSGPWSPGECAAFGQNPSYPYRKAGGAEWKYARLAK